MKKHISAALILLCFTLLLSGCVESDIGVTLGADETGSITTTIGIEEEFCDQLIEMGGEAFAGKETTTYTHDGKTYVAYTETKAYQTYEEIEQALLAMTYDTDALADLEDDTDDAEAEDSTEAARPVFKSVEIEKSSGIFYTTYSFAAELNPQPEDDDTMLEPDLPLEDVFHMTFSVEMPAEITQVSGGSVEGNKVSFEIEDLTEANQLSVTAEETNIVIVVVLLILLIVLLGAAVAWLKKRVEKG